MEESVTVEIFYLLLPSQWICVQNMWLIFSQLHKSIHTELWPGLFLCFKKTIFVSGLYIAAYSIYNLRQIVF